MSDMINNLKQVLSIFENCNNIFNNENLDWKVRYKVIFVKALPMYDYCRTCDLKFPDYSYHGNSYEEDVTSFMKAFQSFTVTVQSLLDCQTKDGV